MAPLIFMPGASDVARPGGGTAIAWHENIVHAARSGTSSVRLECLDRRRHVRTWATPDEDEVHDHALREDLSRHSLVYTEELA